jgi:uncharacterized protein YjgD (DUF1641 family)
MAFSFIISQLDSIPSLDGMEKVISVIHWRAQKVFEYIPNPLNKIKETGIVDTYGALSVPAPHEASFTPYDEVTKEMVEGWLEDSLDCEAIEANLDSQIQNFLNPPVVAYKLPWQSNNIS